MQARALKILGILYIFLSSGRAASWQLCGPADAAFSIFTVEVSPDPVGAGAMALFKLIGYQQQGIEVHSGILEATVNYLGIQVFTKSGELCSALHCPLLPGEGSLELEESMPPFLPPGKMELTLQARRNDSLPLFCVVIELSKTKDVSNGDDARQGSSVSSLFNVVRNSLGAFQRNGLFTLKK